MSSFFKFRLFVRLQGKKKKKSLIDEVIKR